MVNAVMDKQDYISKAQDLQADKDTYCLITGNLTTKHKNKLTLMLRTTKAQGGLDDVTYKIAAAQILWTP